MWRLIKNLVFFWRAGERRAELHQEMRTSLDTQRAIAEAGQDYFLKRDLARLKEEEERKQR